MIALKELRIGNWIYSNPALIHPKMALQPSLVHVTSILPQQVGVVQHNLEYRVEFFDDSLIANSAPFFTPEELEPILLTDEWLSDFGFVKEKEGWRNKETAGVTISLAGDMTFSAGEQLKVAIRYVHQLQNLYFALAGQELELEE